MSDGKRVRVAVWGVGPHARRRALPALALCPGVDLVGLTTRNRDVGTAEAARWGCRRWDSPAEMLASTDVDAVYVATPIGLHGEQGLQVLRAGKHLWCEKSLTATERESVALLELARELHLCVCEAFMYRYHPLYTRIWEIVRGKELGQLISVTSRLTLPVLENPGFRLTRGLGGGALLDAACYPLSLALALCGGGPRTLWATIEHNPEFGVDTRGAAVMDFQSGAYAFMEWGYGLAYCNEASLLFDGGSVYADRVFSKPDDWSSSITVKDQYGEARVEMFAAANAFVNMFVAFADAAVDATRRDELIADAAAQASALAALRARVTDQP